MKSKFFLSVILTVFYYTLLAQSPSFEKVLSLKSISSPTISPDGKHVVYQVQTTDWDKNRYDRELWIAKEEESPFQLTNNLEGNSSGAKWSLDGKSIAFLQSEDKRN